MARVNLLITARDLTAAAFTRINQRANRLNRTFTRVRGPHPNILNPLLRGIRRIPNTLTRSVRDGTQGSLRTVGRFAQTFVRTLASSFQGGIGQGIGNALRNAANNPYVAAGVAFLAVSLAAMIGAAIGGVLVLAFGAAFVGLGGFLASQSEKVKSAWSKTTESIKSSWKDAGRALEPVMIHGMDLMEDLAGSFLPHFEQAMSEAKGPLTTFLDSVASGIKKFGKAAFEPMMQGFDALLLAFGPDFEGMMQGMGDAFGALGRTVREHSGEISMAITGILGLITTMIDVINFLAVAWTMSLRIITAGFGYLMKGLAGLLQAIVFLAVSAVDGFDRAFGWIPGLGGKLKDAKRSMNDWADSVSTKMNEMGDSAIGWGKRMDAANKERSLKVDINSWQAKLELAKQKLKSVPKSKQAAVRANIRDLERKIARAKAALASVRDKTVTFTTIRRTKYVTSGKNTSSYLGRAHGGVVGAAASGGVRNNMTMVGEQGPELVDLPVGSRVRSNPDTRRIVGQGGGDGGRVVLEINSGGTKLDDLLVEILRKAVRVRGGNVQLALGRG